jgi:hypothetical protein
MTLDEVRVLSDRKLDAMIAEASGWKNIHRCETKEDGLGFTMIMDYAGEYDGGTWRVPRYSQDLNDIQQAEAGLMPEQFTKYLDGLCKQDDILNGWKHEDINFPDELLAVAFKLTSRQRAEALLMALTEESE